MFFFIINVVFGIILVGGTVIMWRKSVGDKSKKVDWPETSNYTLLSISVPKQNVAKPEGAEQFFAAMHGIFREGATEQLRLSLEIVSRDHSISFRAYVPRDLKDFVVSQIYAQYPAVEIKEVSSEEDYSNISHEKRIVATELTLKKPTAYPIKTFQNFEVDPLSTTTGVLSSLGKEEEIWIQLIVRPIDDDWQEKGAAEVKNIKDPSPSGKGFIEIAANEMKQLFIDFFKQAIDPNLTKPEEKKKDDKKEEIAGPEQQALKAIEEKITKLGFETNIRILAAANDEHIARAKLEQVVGAFKQFNTINLNSFIVKDFVTDRAVLELFKHRTFGQSDMIFNISELATLYHFPSETVSTPTISWAGSKKGEPPTNLPTVTTVPADELTLLGETNFRSEVTKFGIKKKDRRLHSYVIGKTGTGKSTLLENMIYDDIKEGRGIAVVDPHGQLIEHVLKFIPQDRIKDVIYFNPSDHDWPVGFNPVENKNLDPEKKVILSSGVVGVFKKIFGDSWGPRMEYILRNAILGLLDYPHATLLGVMRVLSDNAFRRQVISEIKDPTIKSFFVDEYEKYDPKFRQEAINPIQNKVGQFLSSSIIRNIVGQPNSTIHLEDVMNSGKILLADLSIGRMGEDNSALLGSMLITQIQLAAMSRTNIPEDERRDFYLYVDEFQNFATDSFATILSEARKYRLSLIMAHQYIAQMPETVSDAVFGNIGTMISFRVGAGDASALKEEFAPVFDENDLVNLANYQVYLKMAIDGVTVPAFSAATLAPPTEVYDNVAAVVESSRKLYGRPRADVEDYIAEWSAPIDLNADKHDAERKGGPKQAPGTEIPQDKGFSMNSEGNAPKTEDKERAVVSRPGQKTEILTDRFSRNWYALSGEMQKTKNEPVQQVERSSQESTVANAPELKQEAGDSGQTRTIEEVERVKEGVISEETSGELTMTPVSQNEDRENKNGPTDSQSRGVAEESGHDHLITWEQAEELGVTDADEGEPKKEASDMLPIDEIS